MSWLESVLNVQTANDRAFLGLVVIWLLYVFFSFKGQYVRKKKGIKKIYYVFSDRELSWHLFIAGGGAAICVHYILLNHWTIALVLVLCLLVPFSIWQQRTLKKKEVSYNQPPNIRNQAE